MGQTLAETISYHNNHSTQSKAWLWQVRMGLSWNESINNAVIFWVFFSANKITNSECLLQPVLYYMFDILCINNSKFWDLVIHVLNMMQYYLTHLCTLHDKISTIMVSSLFICRLLTDSVRQSQDPWAGSRDWSEVEVSFHWAFASN